MTRLHKPRPKQKASSQSRPEPEKKPRQNSKYLVHARRRALRSKKEDSRRLPAINLRMIAQNTMEKYGFEHKLTIVVNAKANAHDEFTLNKVGSKLRDLRYLLWSSIDSYYSQNLDQIEYCERGQGGEILVKVAIADVDAFVPKGSILDEHAKINATSVYPGNDMFPMLPEQLSSDLSAFPMDCNSLAIVVEFAVLPRGNVRFGKVYRAFVRNKAQLSSGEIGAWLENKEMLPEIFEEMPELAEQIKLQEEASLRLSKFREQGATDAEGDKTLGLCVAEKDWAKMIVENFMICANKGMVKLLENAHRSPIRRVVAAPKDWNGVVQAAAAKGVALPAEPDANALTDFLAKEKKENPEGFSDLSLKIAKLLGPGEYALFDKQEPIEYFCIADMDYLVGTSPNQKYMDLVVLRLVKAAAAQTHMPYSKAELAELAAWCTERENAAKKVERTVKFAEASEKP